MPRSGRGNRSTLPKWAISVVAVLAASTAFAATITVNSTADTIVDDGVCTLREAIIAANTNAASGATMGECVAGEAFPSADTIAFAIPGAGVHTISPASNLPSILEAVVIDGYTQPSASVNTLAIGDNAILQIEIDGENNSTGTGDVNQNRVVSLADLGLVNAQLAQTVTAANYLKDVNASGTLSLADKGHHQRQPDPGAAGTIKRQATPIPQARTESSDVLVRSEFA